MQDPDIIQLKGYITAWKRSYGFAKAAIGDIFIDVFVHADRFDTHSDRKEAKRGLDTGTKVMIGAKQSDDRRSKYEAVWCYKVQDTDSDQEVPPTKTRRSKIENT